MKPMESFCWGFAAGVLATGALLGLVVIVFG